MSKRLLIKNCKALVQVNEQTDLFVPAAAMQELPILEDAWLAIENGIIADYGSMQEFPGISDWQDLDVIDADGKYVLPSFCDSHTHLVFAAWREHEFVYRLQGLSYQQIAERGGGILHSAEKLRKQSADELYEQAAIRLKQVMQTGTGAIEIKTGYGLSAESEMKMLQVIQGLKKESPLHIKATLLAAHALPAAYKDNRQGYIDMICRELLPAAAQDNLLDFIDVFCEKNYFTPAETKQLVQAAAQYGIPAKIHVNQFHSIGGIQALENEQIRSFDHLEILTKEDLQALKKSSAMPCLLPACSFFLGIPYAPARELIQAGIPIALASDFNPGSSPSGNMQFVLSLACLRMGLLPEEAIHACTLNAAYAMGCSKELGSISRGKIANLFLTKEIPSLAYMPYRFTENHVDTVILNGIVQSL